VAQVYAPEGSALIAFEPMTAPVDALSSGKGLRLVDPGQSFSAEFTIAVDRR
jgi:aldose 1-epimerase